MQRDHNVEGDAAARGRVLCRPHTPPMAAQKKQKVCEERTFLFSSESVNEGHPDKLADQVQQRAACSETLRA